MKNSTKITITTESFDRTESDKGWKAKPHTTESHDIGRQQFDRITSDDTCSWFRRLGGSETVTRCYSSIGYVPHQLSSIDPSRTIKKVHTFKID